MRDYSEPALAEVADTDNLASIVFSRPEQEPQHVVLRRRGDGGRWHDVTAATFRDEVAALAKGMIAAGVEPGDRVGLMSRTLYEWTLIDYAIWAAGAVTVPIYETSSAEQVEWILADSGARAVFAERSELAAMIGGLRSRLPDLHHVWELDGLAEVSAGGGGVTDEELHARRAGQNADALATIIYTSGTTGRPKGCELSHRNLLADVRNAVAGALTEVFDISGASTLLFLPLAHSFARIIQVGCLESGTALGHWPDVATVADGLPEFRPTFLLAVPRVFEKVYNTALQEVAGSAAKQKIFQASVDTAIAWSRTLDEGGRPPAGLRLRHGLFDALVYSKVRKGVGGRVEYAVSGGAALGERLGHFFRGAGLTVLEGYGLTETSAAAVVNRPGHNKIGTVGQPLPGVSLRIADDGEILIKGPNVFAGYWQNKAASADALEDGGWMRTGDLGSLDDEGFLSVTGRKKEIIVTAGGKNVAPAVLEDRLRAHALVSQCMVVGDGKPFIACLVTLDPEALDPWRKQHGKPDSFSIADLARDPEALAEIQGAVDEANKAVSRPESIRKFTVLDVDFEESNGYLTPSLKVKRGAIAKDFAADIDALYS